MRGQNFYLGLSSQYCGCFKFSFVFAEAIGLNWTWGQGTCPVSRPWEFEFAKMGFRHRGCILGPCNVYSQWLEYNLSWHLQVGRVVARPFRPKAQVLHERRISIKQFFISLWPDNDINSSSNLLNLYWGISIFGKGGDPDPRFRWFRKTHLPPEFRFPGPVRYLHQLLKWGIQSHKIDKVMSIPRRVRRMMFCIRRKGQKEQNMPQKPGLFCPRIKSTPLA